MLSYIKHIFGVAVFINTAEVIPNIENGLPVARVDAGQSLVEMRFTRYARQDDWEYYFFATFILGTVILYEQQRKAKR